MAVKDDLGNRMKDFYENRSKTYLIKKMPVIIRLDGKSFHQFTRGFKKPFDEILIKTMQDTMKYLCENIQGCVLGYTQSDEITLVLVDYQTLETDAWFNYSVQKIVSTSAAMATLAFNRAFYKNANKWMDEQNNRSLEEKINETDEQRKSICALMSAYDKAIEKGATFDARAFNIPKEEVTNCVYWRQVDAERNSRMGLCQAYYSQKQLNGLSAKDAIAKLDAEKGIVWGELPTICKRGSCCIKSIDNHWMIDNEIPRFVNEGRDYIENLITF